MSMKLHRDTKQIVDIVHECGDITKDVVVVEINFVIHVLMHFQSTGIIVTQGSEELYEG